MLESYWGYTVPYLLLLIGFYLLSVETRKTSTARITPRTLWLCGFLFLFFFGLRGFVGWDWYAYYQLFSETPSLLDLNRDFFEYALVEPGYIFYISLIKLFTDNYHVFIFISVFIDFILLSSIFNRYNKNLAFSFALFIGFFLTSEINLLRNAKSILIFFCALHYIKERKIVPYSILIFCAFLFHASSILYFPFYFFLHKRIPRKVLIGLVFVGICLSVLQMPFITPLINAAGAVLGGRISLITEMYLSSDLYSQTFGIGFRFIERVISICLVIIYYDRIIAGNPNNILFVNLFIAYILVTLYFYELVVMFDRISTLFVLSYCFVIPLLLDNIRIKNNRRIYRSCVIVYTFLIVYTHTNNPLYRYDNLVWGVSSYEERQAIFNSIATDFIEKK